jgi:hypothetical protein
MTRFFFLVFVFVFVFVAVPLEAQQVFRATATSVIPYLEYLPKDYSQNSDKYPIVFFLHGIGERGPNTTNLAKLEASILEITRNGPPKHVRAGQQFPFILISIQLKENFSTWPTWYVLEVIEHVKTYLRVDERRMHLTGLSLGGGGTWTMGQTYPELFASLPVVCGGYNSPSKACDIAADDLPVWAFHGDADNTVSYFKSLNMVNAINACTPAPSPLAKIDIYRGVKHDAWIRAYTPDHTYHNPNVYEWMMTFTNKEARGNPIPIANSGTDRIISTTSVTLNTTATDNGAIVSYAWSKLTGPTCSLSGENTESLSVSAMSSGKYIFRCQVTDGLGATDTDYVQVTVQGAPTANAGPDATLTLPVTSTQLTGSGTDPDGTINSYKWTFVSGPAAPTLTNSNSAAVSIAGLNTTGNYVFRLEVTDNLGGSATDEVTVFVKSGATNNLPIANAGSDVTITLPSSSASLSGSATDADGTISSYQWTFISGPSAPTLTNANTKSVSVSGLTISGNYVFQLEAKDNAGASGLDQVTVIVKDGSTNKVPVANAGSDVTITLPTSSQGLTGSATDTDGTISSYQWIFVSGPKIPSIANATTVAASVSGMNNSGSYVFQFEAKDNQGAIGKDQVMVIVKDATVNQLPVAKAGSDLTITLPVDSTTINGSGTDSDGIISSYAWTFIAGPKTPTLANANTATVSVSDLTTSGNYVLQLEVKDDKGGTGKDQVSVIVKDVQANKLPVANAGTDLTITLPTSSSTLSGSATDADGTISSYQWIFVSGPRAPAITSANTAKPAVTGMNVAGNYIFQLEVKDNLGGISRDQVTVIVKDVPTNQLPLAKAGSDVTITLPTSAATLTGSATDADGTISSYLWTFVSGPKTPTLANTTAAAVSVSAMTTAGNYIFKLDVKDNLGATASDQVAVIVMDANKLPVVNAGTDTAITLPTSAATLTGSATDSDGTISSYLWSFVSGPKTPTLANTTTAVVSVSAMTTAGNYVFKLDVKDNLGAIGTDQVTVSVKTANQLPVAKAGNDVTITLPTSAATLTGSATDADGTISSYLWSFVSGPKTPTLANTTTAVVSVSALTMAGNYVFKLDVKDNLGAIGTDQVTVSVKTANQLPVAKAGNDVTITLPTSAATLTGSATDADGSISSYLWSFVSGPKTPTLANTTTAAISVSALTTAGNYTFKLDVKDNLGAVGTDQVTVIVREANKAPVVNATDLTIVLPTSSATITGSGTDPDGTISSYQWSFISGPKTPTLANTTTAAVSVSALTTTGNYIFKLDVKDNLGATGSDQVTVVVKPANKLPVANAGADVSITLPTSTAALSGSATDADGTIISYLWTFVSGPIAPTLSGATTATPTASALSAAGSYIFKLEVKDNNGAIATDQVTVAVNAVNKIPLANAGADVQVALPVTQVTLSGAGSDSDGNISNYLWSFVSGPVAPVFRSASASSTLVTGMTTAGSYVFQLRVKDNHGATGTDQVKVTVSNNQVPVVDAGKDVTLSLPHSTVSLSGSATDVGGSIASYQWTQISGPVQASISDASSADATVSELTTMGLYVFKLTATDDDGEIAFDKVSIKVVDISSLSEPDTEPETPSVIELTQDTNPYWINKKVMIYNEVGVRIYSGSWGPNSFEEVLSRGGVFIYNVLDDNGKVLSGRIGVVQ